jgi:thymidylate kinase
MFIVFEGVDRSGKSTLSVKLCEWLNNKDLVFLSQKVKGFTDKSFIWTKEPLFTSDEADRLNSEECKDEYGRESLFFESRLNHQSLLTSKNVVCDRYIWSGLAYAKMFSPNCYEFAKALYLNEKIFVQPDLYIFVDTPIEVCHSRGPEVELERLQAIRQCYLDTMPYIKTPIITISNEYDEETSFNNLIEEVKAHPVWNGA